MSLRIFLLLALLMVSPGSPQEINLIGTGELAISGVPMMTSFRLQDSGFPLGSISQDGKLTLAEGVTQERFLKFLIKIYQRDLDTAYNSHDAAFQSCMDGWQRSINQLDRAMKDIQKALHR